MRLIKMFGLAAIAAVAAMAFIGASSASATFSTALCTEASAALACPAGKLAEHVHFVAEKPELLTPLVNVLCETALLLGLVENKNAKGERILLGTAPEPLKIEILSLIYSECMTKSGSACEVKVLHLGLLDVLKTAADLATVEDLEVGGKYSEVNVHCGLAINCTYKGEGLIGHALSAGVGTGNTTGHVTFTKAAVRKVSGALCPETSELDALFKSLPGEPLWIRS